MNRSRRIAGVLALAFLFTALMLPQAFAAKNKKSKTKPQQTAQVQSPAANDPKSGDKAIDLEPAVRFGTLPNGMKYYIRHNKKPEKRVEMRLAVNAGANQEDDDQKGLAHFVEHMAFNGSEHFAKNDLINFLEGVGVKFGAHLNAYTSFDETVYMLQLPTDKPEVLDKGLLVLQDWAGGLSFDHQEIDKERGVVVSEWRNGLGANQRMLYKWLPVYYYQSRYAERLPIGDTGVLNRAPYERFSSFYKDWYRPDLMAVMIVGDINVDSMEAAVKARFSGLKNPAAERPKIEYKLPEHDKTLVSICTDPEATITRLYILHKHPAADPTTVSGYRNYIMNSLLNSMLNRRLSEIAQKPDAPFLQAVSMYDRETRLNDAFSSTAFVKPGKTSDALRALLTENERAKRFGFNNSELELAKVEWMKGMEDALKEKDKTESRSLVQEYVSNFLEQIPAPGIEKEFTLSQSLVPGITVAEINQLISTYVSDKNRVIIVTAPELEKKNLPWENEILELANGVKQTDLKPYEDKVADQPLFPSKPKGAAIVKETKSDSFSITTLQLANGVRVIVKPTDFKNDEILFTAYSPGGTGLYPDADFMNADYSNLIISEAGIAQFDRPTLQKMLVGKTVSVGPYVDELKEGFSGQCAPADLETMLQLVNLYFTKPRQSTDDFTALMNKEHGQYDHILDNPQYYFINKFQETIFNNNIRRGIYTKEKLDQVNFGKAVEIYKERFGNAADFTFVFVGNVNLQQLKPLLEAYLGSLPASASRETWKDPNITKPIGAVKTRSQMGNTPKTLVGIHLHNNLPWSEQEEYNFNALVKVLSITLREALREDKGGVYGVGVNGAFTRRPQERYGITIQFNADPARADELIQLVYSKIEELRSNGTTDEKISKVKETQLRERETDLQENGFWLNNIEYYDTYGMDIARLNDYLKLVNGLTKESILIAANKYLGTENKIEVVLEPNK